MLLAISVVKLIAEIGLAAFFGRWVVGVFAGAGREANPVHALFRALTRPFLWLAMHLGARKRSARVQVASGAVLALILWLAATVAKIALCFSIGVQLCR